MANITVYSTPTCGYCTMLKDFLNGKNVEFTEIDVAADQEAAKKMVEKTGQMGVPVSIIELEEGKEEVVIGFDQAKIIELLGLEA